MSDPTQTGEPWTTASVELMLEEPRTFPHPYGAGVIADAHNAALADQKRDLWEKISLSRIEADNWKGLYEKNLAALAAEREKRESIERIGKSLAQAVDERQAQLDAAVEALRNLYENPSPKTARKAQSVLAKVAG